MIKFVKDLNDMILRGSWKWLKLHWKGFLVCEAVVIAISIVWVYMDNIVDFFKRKFGQKRKEAEI